MGKSRSRKGSARKPVYCGECVWIWIGTQKKGRWVRDPVARLLGIDCKAGCKCVDANTLGIKGKPFQRLIVMCKKSGEFDDCSACSCTFSFQNGIWNLEKNNCGPCGDCSCTDPGLYREWGKVRDEIDSLIPVPLAVTWCH